MAPPKTKASQSDTAPSSGALTHSPFAALAGHRQRLAKQASGPAGAGGASRPGTALGQKAPQASTAIPELRKLIVRLEAKGSSGQVVTRIRGLPVEILKDIGSRLQTALGCNVTLDSRDLLLAGSLVQRAEAWLQQAGELQFAAPPPRRSTTTPAEAPNDPYARTGVVNPGVVNPGGANRSGATVASSAPSSGGTGAGNPIFASRSAGTQRSEIKRGQRVAIVLKEDQPTGDLTEGVVRDLLTSSPTHPHGIKVRLESGAVGRVKRVFY